MKYFAFNIFFVRNSFLANTFHVFFFKKMEKVIKSKGGRVIYHYTNKMYQVKYKEDTDLVC